MSVSTIFNKLFKSKNTSPRVRSKNNRIGSILLLCCVIFISGIVLWSGYLSKNYYLSLVGVGMFGASTMMIINEYLMVWEEAAYLQSVSRVLSKTSAGPDLELPFILPNQFPSGPVSQAEEVYEADTLDLILREAEAQTLKIGLPEVGPEVVAPWPITPLTEDMYEDDTPETPSGETASEPLTPDLEPPHVLLHSRTHAHTPENTSVVEMPPEPSPETEPESVAKKEGVSKKEPVAIKKSVLRSSTPAPTTFKSFKPVTPAAPPSRFQPKK